MAKMTREHRAKQFLPFNSLRGYYDLIKKTEKIKTPRKLLADEELEMLLMKFNQISKGMVVSIRYYDVDGYTTLNGMISNVDLVYRTITIVKTTIALSDIIEISAEKIKINNFDGI